MRGQPSNGAPSTVEMSQNDAGDALALRVPRQELERVEVGLGEDVGLLDPAEAVDRAAVEGHPLLEGVLELRRGDVEGLLAPEHVGEPQLDVADPPLLDGPKDVVGLLL